LWLNITKRLLRNIARDIARHNEAPIEQLNRSNHSSFDMYFNYLHNICNLKSLQPNPKIEKSIESLHNDMTGVDAEKFFSNLLYLKPLFELFTNGVTKYRICTLFYKTYMKIRHNGYVSSSDLKKDTWKFMDLYLDCYQADTNTPYIHLFVVHLHEQFETFKNIQDFSTQGI
jgi:hypothetical protein